jgi:tRNA pseudouridine55 synthase
MDGIININKPRDLTSFDIVARVKRIVGERHTGHAGTLDPLATGVLPVCLGKGTRIIEFLFHETKTYQTEIELGITTDSYDCTGKVIKTAGVSGVTLERVEVVLSGFRGTIAQIPPMYSAIKHKGTPLYKLARSGIEVERKSRTAVIYRLELLSFQPPFINLEVVCSKGTYIRSLANDIGEALGCGAVMKNLVRTKVGPFRLEDAITLEQLEDTAKKGYPERFMYPPDFALQSFDTLIVSHEQVCSLIHGKPLNVQSNAENLQEGLFCRIYNEEGGFVGMVQYEAASRVWQPRKIFLENCCRKTGGIREVTGD